MSAGVLVTVGSSRQARPLAVAAASLDLDPMHIDDRAGSTCVSPEDLVASIVAAVRRGGRAALSAVHVVSVARASTPGAVLAVARACEHLAAALPDTALTVFAPSTEAARIFEDKWLTYEHLVGAGVQVVPSRLVTGTELAGWRGGPPVVVKVRDHTGGVGVAAGCSADDFGSVLTVPSSANGVLVAEFIDGLEFSVKVLVLGDLVLPVALVLKEPTRLPLVHGDWKVKMSAPLHVESRPYQLAAAVARSTGVAGYLSVEGILRCSDGAWLVSEVAARRTGSHAIADAVSTSGATEAAILSLLLGRSRPAGQAGSRIGFTLVGRDAARKGPVLDVDHLGEDVDDLSALAGSTLSGVRTRTHYACDRSALPKVCAQLAGDGEGHAASALRELLAGHESVTAEAPCLLGSGTGGS
ncbi:hypothetical protein DQ237_12225 [Blastococcus sp. TF02-8]|uniref:ATP-grasp domain-containing protein n=1 Tax=Blastococcus sp. TF02-8 TaxID=2250574 RepID=UPI000DE8BA2D|nr:ATP-grasp domain-containing protein [Blastococcus sp. TF02-8]RBY95899.1 hypothetical protein DQ237_12225 [Blastococcus sp. TF02-8]